MSKCIITLENTPESIEIPNYQLNWIIQVNEDFPYKQSLAWEMLRQFDKSLSDDIVKVEVDQKMFDSIKEQTIKFEHARLEAMAG